MNVREIIQALNYEIFTSQYEEAYLELTKKEG
jgi:hypothetical protein